MAVSPGKTLTIYLAADLKKFNSGMTQAQGGLKGFANSLKKVLGPAAIGAGIALGALATKMAVDGVQAALADEQAVQKLATTLDNLGLAHDTTEVEAFIYQLERSLGVADTELRPAYDRLVRSIGNVDQANEALSLSLDIAAGSGKSLKVVTEALGKAYDGQSEGLSRLGGGIDEVILRTGDMVQITQMLATTFGGQAQESAETFSGKMRVLKTAVDNLTESFGRGLVEGMDAATSGTTELTGKLEDLEDEAESAGRTVSAVGITLAGFAASALEAWTGIVTFTRGLQKSENALVNVLAHFNPMAAVALILGDNLTTAGDAAYKASPAMESVGNAAAVASGQLNSMSDSALSAAQATELLRGTTYDSGIAAAKAADLERRLAPYLARRAALTDDITTSTSGATSAVEGLTKWEERAVKSQDSLSESLKLTEDDLESATAKFFEAGDAVRDYASAIQGDLLSGIDLGGAFGAQFDEAGNATGETLIGAFNKQIEQATWFGNVLNEIKRQNADVRLIEAIAGLGPAAGGKLGQQLIDDGLIPTMSDKFASVQDVTADLAMSLVPEYKLAGVASAAASIVGLTEGLQAEQKTLTKLGKNMAKPVGAAFKSRLAKDVLEAVRNVEAAATSARAERVAQAERAAENLTSQAVAEAFNNILRGADARSGSRVQPVLG